MSPCLTLAAALGSAADRLAAAGIDWARAEARLLARHALGLAPETVLLAPDRPLEARAAAALDAVVARRAAREPMARITGEREFWSLPFAVGPETLIPRPDSESVVEAALAAVGERRRAAAVLDLGTGSGCLLLALLSELPNATGLGIDVSPGAVDTARRNAAALGLAARAHFAVADWKDRTPHGLRSDSRFDLIVANPPYVPSAEIDRLQPEIAAWEPRAALDGGADGLDAYRALAPLLARMLAPGATVCVELGFGQADAVTAILTAGGLVFCGLHHDLCCVPRCLVVRGSGREPQKMVGNRDDRD